MEIDALVNHALVGVSISEPSWFFEFDDYFALRVDCPWRLVSSGRIAIASNDHSQQFGLSHPIDVTLQADQLLRNIKVKRALIREDTKDLLIEFDNQVKLEVFLDSSGFECWELCGPGSQSWIGRNDIELR